MFQSPLPVVASDGPRPQVIAADEVQDTYVMHSIPFVRVPDEADPVPLIDYLRDMEARLMAAITGDKQTT